MSLQDRDLHLSNQEHCAFCADELTFQESCDNLESDNEGRADAGLAFGMDVSAECLHLCFYQEQTHATRILMMVNVL
jgi:hypothetical protein